jgi:TetR/AcrR family transcriptional regulator, transcriptional repressor for nem operon
MKVLEVAGSPTKLRIIQTAANLFHKQGIHLTSPDDIIEASSTGKGQFYHYFKNKEALVHEVMQFHLDAIENGTSPVNYDVDSWQGLERWFNRHLELQKMFEMTRGCPIGTVGNDVTERDELIRQDVALIFDVMKRKLVAFFLREKAGGHLAGDANEEGLAILCIATIQGAMLLGKVARNSTPAELVVKEALAHVRSYRIGS